MTIDTIVEDFRLPAQKMDFWRKIWNIALFWKIGLDFETQYLRFYWTDFAKIWYAGNANM